VVRTLAGRGAGSDSVCGIALVGQKLFVLHYADRNQIDVYSIPDFAQLDSLSVPARKDDLWDMTLLRNMNRLQNSENSDDLWDMTSCAVMKCLYISNKGEQCLHEIDAGGEQTGPVKWPVEKRPYGLSLIRANCHILVSCREDGYLIELDPRARTMVQKIHLPKGCLHPLHAFQLDDGTYLVSHGYDTDSTRRVCKVTRGGKVVRSYGDEKGGDHDHLDEPCHIAMYRNDVVFVADFNNGRVVMLNPSLRFVRNATRDVKGTDCFQRLCLDDQSKTLYVGDFNGSVTVIRLK